MTNRESILRSIGELGAPLEPGKIRVEPLLGNLYISVSSDASLGIFLKDVFDDPDYPNLENIKIHQFKHCINYILSCRVSISDIYIMIRKFFTL